MPVDLHHVQHSVLAQVQHPILHAAGLLGFQPFDCDCTQVTHASFVRKGQQVLLLNRFAQMQLQAATARCRQYAIADRGVNRDARFLHAIHISVCGENPGPARAPARDIRDYQAQHVRTWPERLANAGCPPGPSLPLAPRGDASAADAREGARPRAGQ